MWGQMRLFGYRISSQELDVYPNISFCSLTSPVQGAENPVGGYYYYEEEESCMAEGGICPTAGRLTAFSLSLGFPPARNKGPEWAGRATGA